MKIQLLSNLTCPCCESKELEELNSNHISTDYKCIKCGLLIIALKECCHYEIMIFPRNTQYVFWDISSDLRMGYTNIPNICFVCGKPATLYRSGAACNEDEWGNPCEICGAMMHTDECGGFSEDYCPECRKWQK